MFGFVLAMVRASAWIAVSPPFNSRMIPAKVKMGVAASLSFAVAPKLAAQPFPTDTPGMIGAIVMQVFAGLALGFVALVLFTAVQTAGELLDLFGGFTVSPSMDPLGNAQSTTFGRFYNLLATVLLFVINGHIMLVRGFWKSFDAVGTGAIHMDKLSELLLRDVGIFFMAAIEIAGPLLAALFLAEIGLGLLARAAPQLNVFALSFPVKI